MHLRGVHHKRMVCSLCGEAGHNRTRCAGGGAIKKKKKKSKPQMFWCAPGMVPVKRDGVVVMMSETELYGDKIQCKCGGWHLPCGTAKGAASWRAHQDTQQHIKWQDADMARFDAEEEAARNNQRSYAYGGGGYMYGGGYGGGYGGSYGY